MPPGHQTSQERDIQATRSRGGNAERSVSTRLRSARRARGLSQQELAARLGLRQRQISDLERGAVDMRLSTIQNVARALDLELMLVPRTLISAVEAMQRAGGDAGRRPLYALDEDSGEPEADESHLEVGESS